MAGKLKDEIEKWLKNVEGVMCFTEKMKIYAPTCYGQCMDAVEKLIKKVNKIFGGSTVYDAEGSWVEDDRVITEPVKVIEVGHRCTDPETAREFAEAIVEYAEEAGQSAIAIHQNDFYIAPTPELLKTYEKIKRKVP